MQGECNDASDVDVLGRLFDALAIDADVALLDDVLRESAALHQPDEEEEAVDPHFFLSFANSAKGCEDGAR